MYWKTEVKLRDGRCVNCCSPFYLEVHHIVPRSQGGEDLVENGITFCGFCHVPLFHDKSYKYKVKKSWLDESQINYIIKKKGAEWKKIDWEN